MGTIDLHERVDDAIRSLTGTHDSAERSRMCHEMLDNPGWLLRAIDDLEARSAERQNSEQEAK